MSVVFVNRFFHPDHSATSQIVSDLAAGLATQGMAVTVVASRQRYDDSVAGLPASESWQGVEIHRVWTSRYGRARLLGRAMDYLTFYASLPWVLCRVLRRGDVVVAKTDPPLVSLLVAPVAWLRGAVMVNWLQDVFPEVAVALGEPPIPKLLATLLRKMRNASLRMAAMNVAIGSRMAEYFVAQGVPSGRVQVIPNWAHEDAIRPMPSGNSQLRHAQGLADRFVVGYSGNLGRAHDIDTLFDAVRRLSVDPRIAFLITGGGHGYMQLQQRAVQADLDNIRFMPYQPLDQLSDSMAAADLHLVSLRPELEGLIVPSKFYGIAAAERPMAFIGDLDGELARLISVAGCGFSVQPGQGDLLANAIRHMAADPEAGREQGRCGRRMLDESYSRAVALRQWEHLLDRLGAGSLIHN